MGAPMDLTSLASELADKPAYLLAETGETLSYRDLEDRSNQVAHLFRSLGLGRGDHVAVLMENRLDLFPIYWAAQRSGLYYTPVNWHLTADEAAYIVDNCGATVLVSSADREELAAHAASRASALRHRLVVGGDVDGVDSLADRTADLPTTPVHDQSEGYYMFYSSGTTGRPKGILPAMPDVPFGTGLTLDHQLSQFGFSHDATYLSTGPLYHAAPVGWSMAAVRHGATAVVMTRFDAELTLAAIEDHQVTHAQFVPTMFVRMLKLPAEVRSRYDLSSLVLAIHAAAPCPVPVKEAMIEWLGPKVLEYYAGSEANCFFAISAPEWLSHKGSVGRAVIGAAHVLDAGGDELPAGEVGQLWFDGPGFEYHRDPDQTAAAHDARGWSTMGDLGWVDGEGYLYLADRRTDLIISGGVNIYPREVEEALAMHPCVQDIAVIGVPDDEMGQRVHAVVHAVQGVATGTELAAELVGAAARTIAGFKLPRSVEFVEDFPRLPSGKVLRRRLVDTYSPENAHRVPHPPQEGAVMNQPARHRLGARDKAAVVVVECQEGVLGESSMLPALSGPAGDMIGPLTALLEEARRAGVPVVHATYAGPLGGSARGTAPLWKALAPATDGWTDDHRGTQVLPALLGEGDLVLPRHHGLNPAKGTELLPVLRGKGVDTIILTGVSVNLALPLIAGEATEEGFYVVVPRDAVAGTPADYARQVLPNTLGMLATLTTVSDLADHWHGA